jgi:sialate O-acetylesterase
VVVIGLGIPNDVHYPNKKPVGDRLAIAARGMAYGERIEVSGPLFTSATFDGGKASVNFTHTGSGLTAAGGTIKGFTLCGADRKWVRADAAIDGDKVIVTSEKVREPVAVRYGWERNPECTLINKDGLPASPFRSDDFQNYFTRDGGD